MKRERVKWKFSTDVTMIGFAFNFGDSESKKMKSLGIGEKYDGLLRVEKPEQITDSAIREGHYWIREFINGESLRSEYYFYDQKWFKSGDGYKSSFFDRIEFLDFPMIPDKEYAVLNSIPRERISKKWQDNLSAYNYWREGIRIRRDVKKSFLFR